MDKFETCQGFCPSCGTILPPLRDIGNISCYNCKMEYPAEVFGDMEVEYVIQFNTYNEDNVRKEKETENETDGPVVDRKCSRCNHEKMSYATVQLRSADEGQTVFFTCLKCKYKESENS